MSDESDKKPGEAEDEARDEAPADEEERGGAAPDEPAPDEPAPDEAKKP